MDPMQALNDLDLLLQQVSLDRKGTLHVIACVASIRAALQPNTGEKTSGDNS